MQEGGKEKRRGRGRASREINTRGTGERMKEEDKENKKYNKKERIRK